MIHFTPSFVIRMGELGAFSLSCQSAGTLNRLPLRPDDMGRFLGEWGR